MAEYKPKSFKITLEDPDEAEEFLRGLVLAQQNNNSQYFPMLIDGVNSSLEKWRKEKVLEEVQARKDAGMD